MLGYQKKMNSLKAMEVQFDSLLSHTKSSAETQSKAEQALERSQKSETALRQAVEQANATKTQLDGVVVSTTATQQATTAALASVRQQNEDAARLVASITSVEGQSKSSGEQITALFALTQAKISELGTLVANGQTALTTSQQSTLALTEKADKDIDALRDQQKNSFEELSGQLKLAASILTTSCDTSLNAFNEKSKADLLAATQKASLDLTKIGADWNALATKSHGEFRAESNSLIKQETENLESLTAELRTLELQIKEQIEKAVGFSLFNAFQKRQESIVTSKKFWQWALFVCVAAGVVLGGYFIHALQGTTKFEAAYFAKLSLSLPVIYAISFCNIQYGKERRLEEEYAFKASISVSLNPYQELVGRLVNLDVADERAKYTDFIISSINSVFESPTDKVYESDKKQIESSSLENITKQLGPILEPLAKIFGHK